MPKRSSSRRHRKVRQPGYQVFISHATADKGIAVLIDGYLRSKGLTTFRDDRDIEGGQAFPETIRDELQRSQEVLVLWSPQALASEWVRIEISVAWGLRKRLVPLLYLTEFDSLPSNVRTMKAFKLQDVERCVAEIKARARKER